MSDRQRAFSLVEVVLALGVISFAIVAILGVLPVGLSTSHSAQDDTRAAHIAQSILGTLTSQNVKRDATGQPILDANDHLQLNDSAQVPLATGQPLTVDLTVSASPTTPDLFADNDGQLTQSTTAATYAIRIAKNTSPIGFDPPSGGEVFAAEVTVSVGWPANAPTASQTTRNFIRVISKY